MSAANLSGACEFLEWDSRFFERRIGQVRERVLTPATAGAVRDWCAANDIDCLYYLADASDRASVRVAEAGGFSLVDVRVTLEWRGSASRDGARPPVCTLRPTCPDDVPALKAMASKGFRLSRFYYDEHFEPAKVDLLYATWIEKSCAGYADAVLVADVVGEPMGYVSCHVHGDGVGQIGLLGVRDDYQGRGLGRALVSGALAWFGERGSRAVRVVTQARNLGALRAYEQSGFLAHRVELWYHWWRGGEAGSGV